MPGTSDWHGYAIVSDGDLGTEWGGGEIAAPVSESPASEGFAGGLLQTCPADDAGWGGPFCQPAVGEFWLDRPLNAGWFVGGMRGSTLVSDWVEQEAGFYGGLRLGWDYDPHWGCEMRLGFTSLGLDDSDRARTARAAADLARGIPEADGAYYRFDGRSSEMWLWDVDLIWYPWGEVKARPYFFVGLGAAHVDFVDRLDHRVAETVFQTPFGVGLKTMLRDWLVLRLELGDNYIVGAGSGFEDLANLSLTAGMEVRFGGSRTAYWPYHPGRHYW